ncbi:glutaminase [Nocardioides sp.]|uniref:glutaminase n=1 Tax=Nocardioides sp. TaxID=35761 RepID=UPI002B265059|nr:glutaminase [Nocardioides sp.]
MDLDVVLDQIHAELQPVIGSGKVADYIPGLADVDPRQFGMVVAMNNGDVHATGDADTAFSVQSISKVLSLALTIEHSDDEIWRSVSREPSGNPFNSLLHLDQEGGRPRNPFINAGALVVTDRLHHMTGDASAAMRDFVRRESGNDLVDGDPAVARSEAEKGHRIAAMAHLLASYDNLVCSVEDVLEQYFWQCSLSMTCREVALAAGLLARNGARADGTRVLTTSQSKRINAVMLTCGTYDAAGEFAFRVGLPAKSGVGGGILAVIPDVCTICVWSPGLGPSGNSAVGMAALDSFTTRTGWSIF